MTTYGKWTATGEKVGKKTPCICQCGTARLVNTTDLKSGKSTNCGCVRKSSMPDAAKLANTIHGLSDKTEQWIWSDMKRRCYSPERRGYSRYGGRGIKVCDRWLNGDGAKSGFQCFTEDMGRRPSQKYTLDRIENDGNYTPDNCQWALKADQDYNKRDTFKFTVHGETFNLREAEERFGINRQALYQRLTTHKMAPELAVKKPLKNQ